MQTIKRADLIDRFYHQKGNTIVTASVETSVKLKGGHPFDCEVKQAQKINGSVGFDYEANVAKRQEKNGVEVIEAKPRKWGKLNENRTVVEHTLAKTGEEKRYLQISVKSQCDKDNTYFFNPATGEKLDYDLVKAWKVSSSVSSTQENLPEEERVIVRDIDFNNIKEISMKGEHFIVE